MEPSLPNSSSPRLPEMEAVSRAEGTDLLIAFGTQLGSVINQASNNEKEVELRRIDSDEKKDFREFIQRLIFGVTSFILVALLFGVCIYQYFSGNEKGMDILKIFGIPVLTFLGGLLTGYSYGKLKSDSE